MLWWITVPVPAFGSMWQRYHSVSVADALRGFRALHPSRYLCHRWDSFISCHSFQRILPCGRWQEADYSGNENWWMWRSKGQTWQFCCSSIPHLACSFFMYFHLFFFFMHIFIVSRSLEAILLNFIFSYVYGYFFVWICIHECGCPQRWEGHWIPWKWSYRQLWAPCVGAGNWAWKKNKLS